MHKLILIFSIAFIATTALGQTGLPAAKVKSLAGKETPFNNIVTADSDTAIVVSFWATWCIPCINEMEAINDQLADRQKEAPFRMLAVSVDDARTSSKVRSFVKGKGWEFEFYLDPNNDLKRAFNVNDIPHILIIKKGKIVYQHTGYVPGNEEELFKKIKSL